MRVFPFGSATGENEKRPRLSEKIVSQLPAAPPAVERISPTRRLRGVDDVRVARVELDLVDQPGLRERERRTPVGRRVDARLPVRPGRLHARGVRGRCRARPGRVPIRMWLRVARLDRDPRDRTVVGDGERARRRATSARRRRSSCRARDPPRCHRCCSPRRSRRRSSCRSGRSGRRRWSRSRSSEFRRRSASTSASWCERVLAPPEPAAGRADVERALLRLALRVDRQRRHAAGPLRRLDERLRAEPVDVERVRAERSPTSSSASRRGARQRLLAAIAPWIWSIVISLAGYARSAYASASGPPPSTFAPLPFAQRRVSRNRLRTSRFLCDARLRAPCQQDRENGADRCDQQGSDEPPPVLPHRHPLSPLALLVKLSYIS